jgi:hypothetical protein
MKRQILHILFIVILVIGFSSFMGSVKSKQTISDRVTSAEINQPDFDSGVEEREIRF